MLKLFKADEYTQPITKARVKDTFKMFLPLLIYMGIYITWFNFLEKTPRVHFHEIHASLDDRIPFLKIFVLPYFAWFFYICFAVGYLLCKYEKEDYFKFSIFLMFGMTVFLVMSSVYPTILHLRPTTVEGNDICARLLRYLYNKDTPTNVCPSIHVFNSVGASIALCKSRRVKKGGKIASIILSSLIILSTMFIKQHSIVDVNLALIMSAVTYIVIYRTDLISALIRRHSLEQNEQTS